MNDFASTARNDHAGNGTTNASRSEGSAVLNAVHAFLGRFIAYPSPHAHVAHTLWLAHAHAIDVWETTPRLFFCSPEPASGKTRALEVSELLVPRPIEAVNFSPNYLFRKAGDPAGPPTILLDEIDTIFGPRAKENEEIRGLLNAGHRRGAVAGRCVARGKTIETEEISAYCAVAMAGLGDLPDTILTRSVVVRMRRRAPGEKVEPYRRRDHAPEGYCLRNRLAEWVQSVSAALADARPDLPAEIQDRDADVWEPLIAVADVAGSHWPELARVAAVALVAQSRERGASLGVRLLSDLRRVWGDADSQPTEQLLTKLHNLEDAPWGDLKGKPLDSRGLAARLRRYEIAPRNIRTGKGVVKGYSRQDMHDAWQRYLPALCVTATSATSATFAAYAHKPDWGEDPFASLRDSRYGLADDDRA